MREFRELSVDLIDESDNIRRSFSDEKLQELSASIRQHGILKPLLVRPNGERFTLIDEVVHGLRERRFIDELRTLRGDPVVEPGEDRFRERTTTLGVGDARIHVRRRVMGVAWGRANDVSLPTIARSRSTVSASNSRLRA